MDLTEEIDLSPSPLLVAIVIGIALFVIAVWGGYRRGWSWTGLPEREVKKPRGGEVVPAKTAWDWLQLLVIPIVLTIGGLAFSNVQSQQEQTRREDQAEVDRSIALDARRDSILESYVSDMGALLLDRNIEDEDAALVARTRTLTALRSLDGARKGLVLQFLYDARLIGYRSEDDVGVVTYQDQAVVSLAGADLRDADLRFTDLAGAVLTDVDLTRAILTGSRLERSNLEGSRISAACLNGALLTDANVAKSNFSLADLRGANVDGTHGTVVSFFGADLSGTKGAWKLSNVTFGGTLVSDDTAITQYVDGVGYEPLDLDDEGLTRDPTANVGSIFQEQCNIELESVPWIDETR